MNSKDIDWGEVLIKILIACVSVAAICALLCVCKLTYTYVTSTGC